MAGLFEIKIGVVVVGHFWSEIVGVFWVVVVGGDFVEKVGLGDAGFHRAEVVVLFSAVILRVGGLVTRYHRGRGAKKDNFFPNPQPNSNLPFLILASSLFSP